MLCRPAHAVRFALLGTHTNRMLVGACNPIENIYWMPDSRRQAQAEREPAGGPHPRRGIEVRRVAEAVGPIEPAAGAGQVPAQSDAAGVAASTSRLYHFLYHFSALCPPYWCPISISLFITSALFTSSRPRSTARPARSPWCRVSHASHFSCPFFLSLSLSLSLYRLN